MESATKQPWKLPSVVLRADITEISLKKPQRYLKNLSQNHPFIDGNKRTAFTSTAVFLMLNGQELVFDDAQAHMWLINLYETHRLTKLEVESWLRLHAKPFLNGACVVFLHSSVR